MKKKRNHNRTIIAGFLALYLLSMILSTYLVACQYIEDYNDNLYKTGNKLHDLFTNAAYYGGESEEEAGNYLSMYADVLLAQIGSSDKYQQFSAALYDRKGNVVSKSSNVFGLTTSIYGVKSNETGAQTRYLMYEMDEYLSEEEITTLAAFYDSSSEAFSKENDGYSYYTSIGYDEDLLEPTAFVVIRQKENGAGENLIYETVQTWDSPYVNEAVWKWKNPHVEEKNIQLLSVPGESTGLVYLPYISYGTAYWEKWQEDEWLQDFSDNKSVKSKENRFEEGVIDAEYIDIVQIPYAFAKDSVSTHYILLRQTAHPWLAAMDYMKQVYLMGVFITMACIIKVIYSTNKTYKEKAKLEQMRRDFTNAAAHELKTPLSVIRGFAENLKEGTVIEKTDYYLEQIISQTDQMDALVKEMSQIMELDSDKLNGIKERVSFLEIIEEQVKKLEYQITEKNLHLVYETEEDCLMEGNLSQIKKMVWNLLSNAVEHNREEGSIWIFLNQKQVVIENTGNPIPEEKMEHIFDMFYTGDESRHRRSVHMGLGLYLAKRICDMHDLELQIENTDAGVKAAISVND